MFFAVDGHMSSNVLNKAPHISVNMRSYLWIFHCALNFFCMDLYPEVLVKSSRFDALKTTMFRCSLSMLAFGSGIQTLTLEGQISVSNKQTTTLSSLFSSATQAGVLKKLIHYRLNPDVERQRSDNCKIHTNCKCCASACLRYERLS